MNYSAVYSGENNKNRYNKLIGDYPCSSKNKINNFSSSQEEVRNNAIVEYAPLIKYIVNKIATRLPASIEKDDLFSSGVIGLMDAIDKYDPTRDNKFKTYAEFRIRGAILDELRKQDWVPRSVRDNNKRSEKVKKNFELQFGRLPTEREISECLGIELEEYQSREKIAHFSMISLEDFGKNNYDDDKKSFLDCIENTSAKDPFLHLKNKSVKDILMKTIDDLPEKQKIVLSLYYYEELNLKEIGKILDITESRVSQLHTQAIQKMKLKLKSFLQE